MRYGRIDDTPEQIGRLGGSLKDNIDKLLKLENEIKSISNNIEKIKTLSGADLTDATKAGKNLETFRRINDAIGRISYVNDHMDIFRDFYLNSDIYKEAVKFKPEIENIRTDMCISVERSKGFALRSKDSYENTVKLYANEIVPKVDKLNTELVALQNKLIADVATIEESHLKAFKFLNYHTIIKTCPMSYEEAPFMVVNDERHEIVFNVPEPMCIKQVGEPDGSIVKKSVDLYLKSLVNSDLANGDEPVVVDDLEQE